MSNSEQTESRLNIREQDGVLIVGFKDKKIEDEGIVRIIGEQLAEQATKGQPMVLDLEDVWLLGSAMLGKFLSMQDHMGKKLVFTNVEPIMGKVLKDIELDKVLRIVPNMEDAMQAAKASVQSSPAVPAEGTPEPKASFFNVEPVGNVLVLTTPPGQNILTEQIIVAMRNQLIDLADDDENAGRSLVLDLRHVLHISSAAMGALVTAHKKMAGIGPMEQSPRGEQSQRKLVLTNITPDVMEELLQTMRPGKSFNIAGNALPYKHTNIELIYNLNLDLAIAEANGDVQHALSSQEKAPDTPGEGATVSGFVKPLAVRGERPPA